MSVPTDEEFRAVGYTGLARDFPLSKVGRRWLAAFNGIEYEQMPEAWGYAPNAFMHRYIEDIAQSAGG